MKQRGEATIIVLIVVAVLGGAAWLFKPKFLHGESKRAEKSEQATQKVETTLAKVDEAQQARAAQAAASVTEIVKANAMAEPSPTKDFISQEGPVALAKLPAPDLQALLEAEKRRSAVMEGRVQEASALYAKEAKNSLELASKLAVAVKERGEALEARRQADNAISEAAAANLATERQRNGAILVAGLLLILWGYAKLTHLSPASIGQLAKDLRNGEDPITALSILTPPWIHKSVQNTVKLSANLDQPNP